MLNVRKLAIFGFLVAALLVSTSSKKLDEAFFKKFKALVEKIDNETLSKFSYKHQIDLLDEVEDDLKVLCVDEFKDESLTPKDAYKALNRACLSYSHNLEKMIKTHKFAIDWQFFSMVKRGTMMEFSVHKKKLKIDGNEMKSEIKLLTETYKDERMTNKEAELWVILHEYDRGILGDLYTGKRPGNLPTSGANVPIENRFEIFKASVKTRVNSGIYTFGTHEYQIDLLDKVEYDLKLRCLKEIEKGEGTEFEPKYAYAALDGACKYYVYNIKQILEVAKIKFEIEWQFDSMLKHGNIMKFFVHKNDANKNKSRMRSEIDRLRKTYKEEGMTNEEAELWVILYKYDEGILGNHYTKGTRSNPSAMLPTTNAGAYPGERQKNTKSTLVTPKPGEYMLIENRFQNFIAAVKTAAKSQTHPSVTFKYEEIDLLKGVDLDFKLLCLKEFDKSSDDDMFSQDRKQFEKNEPNVAYKALDKVCKEYLGVIKETIKTHEHEIHSSLNSILKNGKIIQFLHQKNNLIIGEKEMETKSKLVKDKYKNERMTNKEAELWVILHECNMEIIGRLYPDPTEKKPGLLSRVFK